MNSITKHRILRALSPAGFSARVLVAVALAGVMTSACDVHGVTDPGTMASMTVTPNATLVAGSTQQMLAVGHDAEGRDVSVSPTWSVAASGGTISASGLFTAGTVPGLFPNTVVATSGGISASASITVIPGPVATITVTPTPVTLAVTTTQQFIAVGKDASGNIVQFTPTWSVVAGGGAVSGTGVFTAGAVPGTYTNTVQATSGGIRGFATVVVTVGPLANVTVTPNPVTLIVTAKQQFVAVGKDASGNTVPIAATWSVVAGGGTVDGAGLFTAGAALGTFTNTIKATSGTLSGTATVVVIAGPLATITVTPSPATMAISATQQFIAIGSDAAGNPVVIAPTWAVVASGGTVNATGLFTAGTTPGTFTNTVRASAGGLSGFATVNVTTGPLASITVTPNPVSMPTSTPQQFVAVGRDAGGNVFVITPVWSVVNGGGAINSIGVFTSGTQAGTYVNTIQATSGTISGTATVTVTAAAPPGQSLATITVAPTPVSVVTSATQQFTATGRDGNGNLFPVSPVWSVVNGGGSINASTGLFTAGGVAGTYSNTVMATSGTISGTATVTVTAIPPVLTTITVSPTPVSVAASATQAFTAVGRDQFSNVFVFTPVWSVVNGGGSIDAITGVFTAGTVAGTFNLTVKATTASGAPSGFATVTVTVAAPFVFVDLGSATQAAILGSTAVTCGSASTIGTSPGNGDVMISPAGASTPGTCTFNGTLYQNVALAATARGNILTAYNTLHGLPHDPAFVVAGLGGGAPLVCAASPCVYWSGSSIAVTGDLTLDGGGNQNAVFVFDAGSSLTGEAPSRILLQNGAKAKNVYWSVGTSATLKTGSTWQGNILALASIDLNTAATLLGRALAHTGAVTLTTANVITLP